MLFLKTIEDKYNTKADTEISIYFESDKITLDIPREGIDLPSGWKIIPLSHPVVSSELIVILVCIMCVVHRYSCYAIEEPPNTIP